jgi:hypothetical protein
MWRALELDLQAAGGPGSRHVVANRSQDEGQTFGRQGTPVYSLLSAPRTIIGWSPDGRLVCARIGGTIAIHRDVEPARAAALT